jgi:hypothetical protein
MVDWTNGYTITSDGIDIGRDGNAVPWSRTPWSSGIDFEESTRNLVQTTTVGGRTFEVYAEPDSLGRGPKGLSYDVEPADGGESPFPFTSVMTTETQVKEAFTEYAESLKEEKRGKEETKQKVQTLENGWVVWTYVDEDGRQLWYIKTDDGQYVDNDGRKWDRQRAFDSESDLRRAIEKVREEFVYGRENSEKKVQTLDNGAEVWTFVNEDGDQRWFIETTESKYVKEDGSTASSFVSLSGQPAVQDAVEAWISDRRNQNMTELEKVEELDNGWILAVDSGCGSGTGKGMVGACVVEYLVVGRTSEGKVYLNSDGSETSSRTSFASKKRARQAFRRWESETSGDEQDQDENDEIDRDPREESDGQSGAERRVVRTTRAGGGTSVDISTGGGGSVVDTQRGTDTGVSAQTGVFGDFSPVAIVAALLILGVILR